MNCQHSFTKHTDTLYCYKCGYEVRFKPKRKKSLHSRFLEQAKKGKPEELWDWISSEIGFDEKGLEIQNAIRKFIKLTLENAENNN